MSISTKPRIIRKHFPQKKIRRTAYREVWDELILDFEERCAYSMQHIHRAGGKKCMEVDHFNPKRKRDFVQDYSNLFLATRHCNGAKRDQWPRPSEQKLGMRFLNCCEETDYGVHIFEDPDSHELVGVTPQGRFHIRACDLNAPHLVAERAERTELWQMLSQEAVRLKQGWVLPVEFEALKTIAEKMIPRISYLTGPQLEKHRARKAALATHACPGS
jgi:HNH endonuclease